MKTRKINRKVPAYINGQDLSANIAGAMGLTGSAMSGLFNEYTGANVAGNALQSAGSLASAGATFGPIGAAVGGVLGAGVGLIKGIRQKKQIAEAKRRQATMKATELGMNTAAANAEDYWGNNAMAYAFENGGIVPNLAYVDNNEIIRDNNGNIIKVPNNKPGTDNHLINATNLDSVLSDNIKRPGTKNTFAKEGEKIMRKIKKSKGLDAFAENTNRLNKLNANKAYEALLAEQEEVKAKRGIKSKEKEIPAYENGKPQLPFWRGSAKPDTRSLALQRTERNIAEKVNKKYYKEPTKRPDALVKSYMEDPSKWMWNPNWVYKPRTDVDGITGETILVKPEADTDIADLETTPAITSTSVNSLTNAPETKRPITTASVSVRSKKQSQLTPQVTQQPVTTTKSNKQIELSTLQPKFDSKPRDIIPELTGYRVTTPTIDADSDTNKYTPDWGSLAPIAYNLAQGLKTPEIDPLTLNPYNNTIVNTLARRKMNIDPILSANARSRAISNYNLANMNANTGANLAARTQAAANEYAANEALYSAKQNTDNAYLAEYANMLNTLGQQYVSSKLANEDLNAKNRAASRNFASKAASQLGEWSQINKKMKNEYNRDQMIWPALKDFLGQGYTSDILKQIEKQYNR